jgi:pimeloyl-ACP methyl ester carboxylesterase
MDRNRPESTTVFFPGLGADSTLAAFHQLSDSDCVWIEWPESISEDWDTFLESLEGQIPVVADLRYVGISFGGLVALGMSKRKPATKGVFLVGSLVDRREVRAPFRWALAAAIHLPSFFFDLRLVPGWAIQFAFGIRDPEHLRHFQVMARRLPPRSVRSLCRLIAKWSPVDTRPSARIHGRSDRMLRPRSDATFLDGGHLISMTNSAEINELLEGNPAPQPIGRSLGSIA